MKEKQIFRDCYNMLTEQLGKQDWIEISKVSEHLIHTTYSEDEDDQFLCAELISVVVNHLDRKRGNTSNDKQC